jgi:hypothetical protein
MTSAAMARRMASVAEMTNAAVVSRIASISVSRDMASAAGRWQVYVEIIVRTEETPKSR